MSRNKFTTFEAAEAFYNLFFDKGRKLSLIDYLDNSFCDEMGEINLNNDSFTIFYHVENKYANPVTNGTYTSLIDFSLDSVLHPEDRDRYEKMMSNKFILNYIKKSPYPNFAFDHFRLKLKDGQYRWAEVAIITGEENGIDRGMVQFYIFDIHNVKTREIGVVNDESNLYNNNIDAITGLINEKAFHEKAASIIKEELRSWCVIFCDIEHFKLFDDWYGRNTGDFLLAKIGSLLNDVCHTNGGVAGYFGQDDFTILYPFDKDLIEQLFDQIREIIVSFGFSFGFMPAFGVCDLKDAKNVIDACDKASVAHYRAKQNINDRINYYDPTINLKSEEEYKILLDFMQALQNEEITFYLQPQCRISTKAVVGAEALARWIKPNGTVISPAVFVPVLEKYSFITDLDKYIWDKVCAWIRSWIDKGHKPVPISINVSQVDIFSINVAEHLKSLVDKYHLSPSLLKVEITESAYGEGTSTVKKLVDELRKNGFIVFMDDFGSGYSSLNMLHNLAVDAIKLDALFLNITDADYSKGIHILESVINMAKTIALPIIVEGVENQKQIDFLVDLGCRYVQGFYLHKPMPVSKFEKIIINEANIDDRGFIVKTNEQIKIREFLDENIYSDTMLNNILGPVAFYSWQGEGIDIIRFNQQFYEAVNASDFHQRLANIERFVPDEDKPKIYQLLKEAMANKANGSAGLIRFWRIDNTLMTFFMRFYYIGDKEGTHRFYGSVFNLTSFTDLREKMSLIAKFSSDTIIFLKKYNGKFSFDIAAHGLAKETGISLEDLDKELNGRTLVEKRLSKADHAKLKEIFTTSYEQNKSFSIQVDFKRDDGKIAKIHLQANPVSDQANNVEYIFTFRLIDE